MNKRFETLSIHGGQSPEAETCARGVSVCRSTSFTFKDAAHAAGIFSLDEPGYFYSRVGNPTQTTLEDRVALLESCGLPDGNGVAAVALASGTSAVFYAIINLAGQGDEIVTASNLYGGTYTMFDSILPQFGITTRFVKAGDPEAFAAAVTPKTRAIYVETIGNPGLEVADIAAFADMAHAHGLPLLVDATFTTPYLMRPLEHGADVVIHSLTKWMGGHGTAIGGIVVDGNNFD